MKEKTENELRAHFKRLGFTNAVIFALVMMRNRDLCRRVISASIGREVENVEVVTTEKTILTGYDVKSVRLDALVEAGGQIFDVEMQVNRIGDIPRRARYYHSMMDMGLLDSGKDYAELPNSYVVFIGVNSLLNESYEPLPARTFEMRDVDTGVPLNDGTITVILDGTAWEKADGELRAMLEFVKKGDKAKALDDENGLASALQDAVEQIKEKERDMRLMTAATYVDDMDREFDRAKETISNLRAQNKEQASELKKKDLEMSKFKAEKDLEISELKAEKDLEISELKAEMDLKISELKAKLAEALAGKSQEQ